MLRKLCPIFRFLCNLEQKLAVLCTYIIIKLYNNKTYSIIIIMCIEGASEESERNEAHDPECSERQ